MNPKKLYQQLQIFNQDECFYRDYFFACQQPEKRSAFIKNLQIDEILVRKLIVPEITGSWLPSQMLDEHYFPPESKNNVMISKHNRFTPAFTHTHRFFEITYVLSGSCQQQIGQEQRRMQAGDICFIAPNTLHSIAVFDESVVINILVRHRTFNDIFFNVLRENNPISTFFNQALHNQKYHPYLLIPTRQDAAIRNHILTMFGELQEQEKYHEMVLNHQLIILFAKLLQGFEHCILYPEKMLKERKGMTQIMSYISEHYQTVSLQDVAKVFHFSAPYCSKLIKDYTGKSFTEIIQAIKFNRATTLLTTTNETIYEISKQVGFENIEHFNRLFKKIYKMTPNAYRRLGKSEGH